MKPHVDLGELFRKLKAQHTIMCIVGKSGSGKTTLAEALEALGYKQVQSYTTRPPRHANEKGHRFISKYVFDLLRSDMVAYTMFAGNEYGATRQQVQECDLYVIDPAGVEELAQHIGRENMFVVYLEVAKSTRFKRMEETRGMEQAVDRVLSDDEKFAGFTDYNMALRNETADDLEVNTVILHHTLQVMR